MRESSKAFQDVVRGMYFENEWILLQTVPCLACSSKLDALSGWHGDDFYTEGEPEALDEVDAMILGTFKAKVLPRLGAGANTEGTILRRTLKWTAEGVHLMPDARHVENLAGLFEVRRLVPESLVVDNEMCWSHWQPQRQRWSSHRTCRRRASFR